MTTDLKTVIANTPRLLLRNDLCLAAADPKYTQGQPPAYIPLSDYQSALKTLSDPSMARPFDAASISSLYGMDAQQGLLYLPYPYLVPGGRFNSMYGWDTAFAVFAWADEHPKMIREQVDNQLYQIRHYGKVLNANRTYHLSRSQPPLIAAMALRVFQAAKGRDWRDFDPDGVSADALAWLAGAVTDLEAQHTYWTTGDRLSGAEGLSRYWDDGDVPAPEVVVGEPGHFEHARHHFAQEGSKDEDSAIFYDAQKDILTPLYYRADRAMRASGFDPTGHWGYGAIRCMFHAPTCLNSLLYRMEGDIALMCDALSRPVDAGLWRDRQVSRKAAMRQYLFNPVSALYEDYDFVHKKRNEKPFATFFHALWAGLYEDDESEARKAADSALGILEVPFGICTSLQISGSQWDHPNGWPPLQYFAFSGMQRCGFYADAWRLAEKYIALTTRVFTERGALFEKYNLRDGNADIKVIHGYHENTTESGTFLWTAAVLKMAQECLAGRKV